jgi:hypothetical protein
LGFKLTPGEEEEEEKWGILLHSTAVGAISSVFRICIPRTLSFAFVSPLFFLTDRFGTLSGVLHDFCVCLFFSFKTVKKSLHDGEREL